MSCLICDRIAKIKSGSNKYFVEELETGYVVLEDHQYYPGYTIFLCKEHAIELHELPEEFKKKYLEEMAFVAKAVFDTFKPRKMNYELLGNSHPHLHWHLIPRHDGSTKPIWAIDEKIRRSKQPTSLAKSIALLRKHLRELSE